MKILGFDYKIGLMDGRMEETKNFGECDNSELTIKLTRGMNRQQIEATLIHEVIEAVSSLLDLGFSESTVRALERGVHGALVDSGVDLSPLLKEIPENKP